MILLDSLTSLNPIRAYYFIDLFSEPHALFRLHTACERAKCALSSVTQTYQYFLMPLTFLQECEDSTGIHRNPPEWDRNPLEWDRNPPESTGMRLDSAGMEYIE